MPVIAFLKWVPTLLEIAIRIYRLVDDYQHATEIRDTLRRASEVKSGITLMRK